MPKRSAGILLYRHPGPGLEVFLVHPGGPFWAKKDAGAWSIPKGEYTAGETPLAAARREFEEETGLAPEGVFIDLGEVMQPGGKVVAVWAIEGECDPGQLRSNTFQMEWPPRSGRQIEVPEVDRGGWYSIEEAGTKLSIAQRVFLDRLVARL